MTGAQERELQRLKKKHRNFRADDSEDELVRVTWTEPNVFGDQKTVEALVYPDGSIERQVGQPSAPASSA